MSIKNIFAIIISLAVISCTDKEAVNEHSGADSVILPRVSSYNYTSGNDETAETKEIGILHACLFENGVMTRVYADIDPLAGIKIDDSKGRLYMVANIEGNNSASFYNIGMTEEEWLSTTILHKGGVNLRYMSGVIDLSDMSHGVLQLYRGVARIDVKVSEEHNLSVPAIMFKNIAQQSYLNRRNTVESPVSTGYNDVTPVIDIPLTGNTYGVAYLCEQASENISAVLTINVDGETVEKEVALPSMLKRNCVYTINVFKESVQADVTLSVTDWENGGDFNLTPNERGLMVDIEGTSLPAYAEVDADRRGIVLSHYASDFILSVDCDDELEFVADPELPMTVERIGGAENVGKNLFRITKKLWGPGMERLERKLMFRRKGFNENYPDDYVNVVMSENPVRLEGLIHFGDSASFDFGRYIDGELAVLNVPDDKVVRLEFDENSPEWMKLEETADGTYRILGGWRPNDADADGRTQEGRIVISDVSGMHNEIYTVKRQNWGLPVVNINGTWWCKYNLRGNVKDFTDQILVSNDPARGGSIADYLAGCTDDEYLNILGDQYQAGNRDGLKLKNDGTGFLFDGYSTKTDNFGTLNPGYMAPDGYEIPDYDDYRFFTWGTDCNLSYFNPGAFNNGLGQRLNFSVVEREATFLGYDYGNVTFYDFEYGGEHLVLCGLGHQWSETGISKKMILFATYGNSGSTWMIEGYSKSEGRGNWFKFAASNAQKTRTIRCVKSPVEYIY
ncbi:hypothetical protein [Bacteroides sp.]|uniref:hypothetical protein n=1 Tax=Bacteroides sp. TaxID=29523 RepID=UPI002588FA40|nr:hypothetical protein [Bacteroides sp.]